MWSEKHFSSNDRLRSVGAAITHRDNRDHFPPCRLYLVRVDDQTSKMHRHLILQYRLRFGSSLLYKSVFHLNRLPAQLSYEGRAAVDGGK
jgi:hypothetical protein